MISQINIKIAFLLLLIQVIIKAKKLVNHDQNVQRNIQIDDLHQQASLNFVQKFQNLDSLTLHDIEPPELSQIHKEKNQQRDHKTQQSRILKEKKAPRQKKQINIKEEFSSKNKQRKLADSITEYKYILLPCINTQTSQIASDFPYLQSQYPDLEVHFSETDFTFTDSDCADGEFYEINLFFMNDQSNQFCEMQTVTVNSNCVIDLKINSIDVTDTSSVTFDPVYLNQLTQFTISNVQTEINIQNLVIDKVGSDGEDGNYILINISESNDLKISNFSLLNNILGDGDTASIEIDSISNSVTIENSSFQANSQGQALAISNSNNINFKGSEFIDNINLNHSGGGLQFDTCNIIKIEDCFFQGNFGGDLGAGGINIVDSYNIDIIDSDFKANTGALDGGAVRFDGCSYINVKNCDFELNVAQSGNGGSILIQNGAFFILEFSKLTENYALNGGGIFITQFSQAEINHSEFYRNDVKLAGQGYGGGIFTTNMEDLRALNNTFKYNLSGSGGGGIGIHTCSGIYLKEQNFYENYGFRGGAVDCFGNSNATIEDVNCYDNYCGLWGGAMAILNSIDGIIVNKGYFQNNTAGAYGGSFFLGYNTAGTVQISNSEIYNSSASTLGGSIIDYFTNLSYFVNVTFQDNYCTLGQGGDVENKLGVSTHYYNVSFIDSKAISGGALYMEISSGNITIEKCNFVSNNILDSQYRVFMSYVTNVYIIQTDISDIEGGTNIGAIKFYTVDFVNITSSTFKNHYQTNGGVIYGKKISTLIIQDTLISETIAESTGGALYLEILDSFILSGMIVKNSFAKNYGSVMYLNQIKNIKIIGNCLFEYNEASLDFSESKGGVAYITEVTESLLIQDSTFQYNKANLHGGVFYLYEVKSLSLDNSTFYANEVTYTAGEQVQDKQSNYLLSQGGAIYFQTGTTEQTYISLIDSLLEKNKGSSGAGIFMLQDKDTNIQISKIDNIVFKENVGDIGPAARYLGESNDLLKIYLENFAILEDNKGEIYKEALQFDYKHNERRKGETLYQFDLCPKGTRLLEGGSIVCDSCDLHGNCDGGYTHTVPKEEYWRTDSESIEFIYCFQNPKRCLGNDQCQEGYKGPLCEVCNYEEGYHYTPQFECVECSAQGSYWVGNIFLILFYVSIAFFIQIKYNWRVESDLTRTNLAKLWNYLIQDGDISSSILKILVSHFQIIYIVNNPHGIIPKYLQSISEYIANPGVLLSKNDPCQSSIKGDIEHENAAKQSYAFVFYWTLMIVFLVLIINYIRLKIRRKNPNSPSNYNYQVQISTLVILFMTLGPGLTYFAFQSNICKNIGDEQYTLYSTDFNCSDSFYTGTIRTLAVFLTIFCLIMPFIFFFHGMYHSRKLSTFKRLDFSALMNSQFMKRVYGYIYSDYHKSFIYWEYIYFAMKVLLIVFMTSFYEYVVTTQVFVLLTILFYSYYFYLKQPFNSIYLNRQQQFATAVQIITVGCNIFVYQIPEKYNALKETARVVISISNIAYFLYAMYLLGPMLSFRLNGIIVKKISNSKFCGFKKIHQSFQRRHIGQQYWAFLRQAVLKFTKLRTNPRFKKLQREILFYNFENEVLIEELLQDNYSELDKLSKEELMKKIVINDESTKRNKQISIQQRTKMAEKAHQNVNTFRKQFESSFLIQDEDRNNGYQSNNISNSNLQNSSLINISNYKRII